MTAVSLQCKLKNHHPEWSNVRTMIALLVSGAAFADRYYLQVYNTTFIRWTTHNPKGLTEKDVTLATLCDSLARDFGELDPEPVACEVRTLADKAASAGGDCCTPKKS